MNRYDPRSTRTASPPDQEPYRDPPYRNAEAGPDGSTGQEAALSLASMASALVFLAGIWLILAPYVWDYSTTGTGFDGYWNDVVIGVAIAAVALVRAATPARTAALGLANVGLGIWLIAAPWVLDYNAGLDAPDATWNDVIVGAVVTTLALLSMGSGLFARGRGRRV